MPFLPFLSLPAATPPAAQAARHQRSAKAPDVTVELGPPPDPGTEIRVAPHSSVVATECGKIVGDFAERGLRVVRSVTSRNERYGVVWRADLVADDDPSDQTRFLCWRVKRRDGSDGYQISIRPLQMEFKSESIGPLQP